MSACIAGTGWITPLGSGIDEVWQRLLAGDRPAAERIEDPIGRSSYPIYRVPPSALKELPSHPRLRRASAISRFATAAGLAALRDGGIDSKQAGRNRIALIFAVANGGVIYTKRFYNDIVTAGADAASPLLFPETVFNAAASHLAAIIGLEETTYTVVGDGSVGITALKVGQDLMAAGQLDYCLIVAAEEADWLLCDAYHKWRFLRADSPVEVFRDKAKGTILSEGAGAILLGPAGSGPVELGAAAAGRYFSRQRDAASVLGQAVTDIAAPRNALVIGSANGTFIDGAEADVLNEQVPLGALYAPKAAFGEGVAASSLWQLIVATQVVRAGNCPDRQYRSSSTSDTEKGVNFDEIVVLSCGLNQQVGAALVRRRR